MKVSAGLADVGPDHSSQQLRGCDPRPARAAAPLAPRRRLSPSGRPRYLGSACSARPAMAAPLPPRLHGAARMRGALRGQRLLRQRQRLPHAGQRPPARPQEQPFSSKEGRFLTWGGKGCCSPSWIRPGGVRAPGEAAALAVKRVMPRVAITSPVVVAAQGGESSHCQTAFRAELRALELHLDGLLFSAVRLVS